jgi:phosphopantothenoylcysteine decarboxylase/phosphopantothenate--cysteine ligase
LEFATGNKPIIELTGKTEHVSFCGLVNEPADLFLICPCTANTISKIAYGIDDTTVTTFATTAIGSKIPILIVPAMHLSMYDHSIVQKNISICKKNGIEFIEPTIKANKARISEIDEIVANVFRKLGKKDYLNKNVLIIGGSTAESIDDIRVVSNRSSGKTAVCLAKNAFYRGANVELWIGWRKETIPKYVKTTKFESIYDLFNLMKKNNLEKFDIIIICAALADFIPQKFKGKIPSSKKKFTLDMSTAPKFIANIRKVATKSKIIGFKVEENIKNIKEKAIDLLQKNNLDFVIANTISGFSCKSNEIWIIDKKNNVVHKKGDKDILADYILDEIN